MLPSQHGQAKRLKEGNLENIKEKRLNDSHCNSPLQSDNVSSPTVSHTYSGLSSPNRRGHAPPPAQPHSRKSMHTPRRPANVSPPGLYNPSITSHNDIGVHNMCKDFVPTKDMLSVLSKGLKMIPQTKSTPDIVLLDNFDEFRRKLQTKYFSLKKVRTVDLTTVYSTILLNLSHLSPA